MSPLKKLELMASTALRRQDLSLRDTYDQYWASRCVLELQYACKLSESEDGAYDQLVNEAIEIAWQGWQEEKTITKAVTEDVEAHMAPIAEKAKSYTQLFIGHAHLDMNWMWGYEETVGITLDTFRTMLDLMNEYPDFTLGQSQASVYEIVEKHDPKMLEEIKQRVHEGRWEVTASTWVEADRNMPNLESMSRHFLYTKQYLSQLLDIAPESLDIDFEPDTFGHHENVPEVLSDAGIKYYYHFRGRNHYTLYNWKAPSGRSILVYCDPYTYNWTPTGLNALNLPAFCKQFGVNVQIRPYGVGDHGGGPTRRDIEKVIDMGTWPIYPTTRFGTYREFYREAEKQRDKFPTVDCEGNFIFDGCYTTQTREKRRNRLGEAYLSETEGLCALAKQATGSEYDNKLFGESWKKVLFNQFHDILPGSGTVDSREYAMAMYQQAFTNANLSTRKAIRALGAAADTSALAAVDPEDVSLTRAEGAGVGFGPLTDGCIVPLGRHTGTRRLFTIYNPLPFEREEAVPVMIWDWTGNVQNMVWTDSEGNVLDHQLREHGRHQHYWGHMYTDVIVRVKTPAMGYATIVLDDKGPDCVSDRVGIHWGRTDEPFGTVLENEYLRIEVDRRDGSIVSYVDKETGKEYVKPGNPMIFRLIEEDLDWENMTAWRVGAYRKITSLNNGVSFKHDKIELKPGALRNTLAYEIEFGNRSKLEVTLALDKGEKQLRITAKVRWQEIGDPEKLVPQLNFLMPVDYAYDKVRYDIPMGVLDRDLADMDRPAQSYAMPVNAEGDSLMLINDSKYGYRGTKEGLGLTLIRSSVYPDPWPEVGEHNIRMAIAVSKGCKTCEAKKAKAFCRGFSVLATTAHAGTMPATQSLLELSGKGLVLSTVKQAEEDGSLIVRCYNLGGSANDGVIKLYNAPKSAEYANLLEQPTGAKAEVDGNAVKFTCPANSVCNLKITF